MDSSREKFMLEEYKQLRIDITQRDTSMTNIFLAGMGAGVALISALSILYFSFKVVNTYCWYFLFVPMATSIISLAVIQGHRKDIRRMGSFIKVFYEDQGLGPLWETAHDKMALDKIEAHDFVPLAFLSLVLLSMGVFWYGITITPGVTEYWWHFCAPLVLFAIICYQAIRYHGKKKYFRKNVQMWSEIYKELVVQRMDQD